MTSRLSTNIYESTIVLLKISWHSRKKLMQRITVRPISHSAPNCFCLTGLAAILHRATVMRDVISSERVRLTPWGQQLCDCVHFRLQTLRARSECGRQLASHFRITRKYLIPVPL